MALGRPSREALQTTGCDAPGVAVRIAGLVEGLPLAEGLPILERRY
jgi:hypothetical protein